MPDNPAVLAWQQALKGQFPTSPEVRNFPPDPSMGGVSNAIRAILSGVMLMPQTATAALVNTGIGPGVRTLNAPAPAAPAQAAPMPTGPLGAAPPGIPAVANRSMVGAGGPREFSFPAGPELPAPPMLPAPPQVKVGGAANYGAAKGMFDAAKPGPVDQASLDKAHWNAVLSGLAAGAGSVDATAPGSFAAALAKAGAGGATGAEKSNLRNFEANTRNKERTEEWQMKRAGFEKDIITSQQAQNAVAGELAFKNAKLVYDTNVANNAANYEYQLKKAGMEMPTIKHDANGISIQQLDPVTRQMKVQYFPTKPMYENLEKMKSVFEALNMDSTQAKAANIQMISQTYANRPVLGREVMKQAAVQDIIKGGAGATVFGKDYDMAAKAAKTELQATTGGTLAAKPEAYMSELNSRIAAILLSNPKIANSGDWIARAIPHSPYAAVLIPSPQPRNPNAPPTPQIAD